MIGAAVGGLTGAAVAAGIGAPVITVLTTVGRETGAPVITVLVTGDLVGTEIGAPVITCCFGASVCFSIVVAPIVAEFIWALVAVNANAHKRH